MSPGKILPLSSSNKTPGPSRRRKTRHPRRPLLSYGTTITLLKIILPTVAVALLALVMLWPQFLLSDGRFQIVTQPTGEIGIDRLSMDNPHFRGTDSQDRPFTVTADKAVQDRADDDLILLAQPKADMILSDGGRVAVQAKQGSYHRDLETLQLAGGVDLVHDQGYEIRTSSANVDLTTKTAEGNDPVAGKGPFGEISSQGFRVTDRGAIIEFTGKSRLVLVDQPEGLP